MGTTLTGKRVQNTYDALLKLSDNQNLTGTAKIVGDGYGNDSPIYLSTSQIGIGITPAYQFHTSGNAKIGGNLIISGNLTVNGTLTYLNVTDLAVEDPLIKLAKDNTANTLDIGLFGKYVATGTKYKGFFNDASDDKFKLFIGTGTEPTTTVDTSASGYTVGTLVANLEGNVTGNVSSLSNHDTDDLSEGSTNLYFTTTRARASFTAGTGVTITNGEIAIGQAVATDSNVTFGNITGTQAIFSSSTAPVIQSTSSSTAENMLLVGTDTTTSSAPDLVLYRNAGATADNDTLGVVEFRGRNDSNSGVKSYSGIYSRIIDASENEGALSFSVNSGNSYINALAIHNTGVNQPKIIIGNTDAFAVPTHTLDVDGTFHVSSTGTFVGQLTIPETPTADAHAASKKYVDDSIPTITTPTLSSVLAVGNTSGSNDLKMSDGHIYFYEDLEARFLSSSTVTDIGLRIKHNGTHSYIDGEIGNMYFRAEADDSSIVFQADDGTGSNTEYFKMDGTDQRIYVNKLMRLGDDVQLRLGINNDIRLYHNSTSGNNNFENHTGSLYITNYADDADIIFRSDDGSGGVVEYFRLDGSENNVLFGRSPHLPDGLRLYFGNDTTNDASIRWDSTASQLFISGSTNLLSDVTISNGNLTLGTDSIASNINAVGDVLGINVDSNTGGGAGANIQLKTAGTTQLTINSSSATFAGDINISAGKKLKYNANSFITPENNTSGAEISTAGTFIVKTGSTPTLGLTVDASQNSSFEGDLNVNGVASFQGANAIVAVGLPVGSAVVGRNHAYNTLELNGYGGEMMIGAGSTSLDINYRTCNNNVSGHTPTTWNWRAGTSTSFSNHNMGQVIAATDMRAPIFYDSNNTAYFVNPSAATSARLYGFVKIGNSVDFTTDDGSWGSRLVVASTVHARIDVAQDVNDVRASWWTHTGQLYSRFGTVTDHNMQFMSYNALRQTLYNGYSQESNSYRAPLFYDSDDTTYYLNPNSSSLLKAVQINTATSSAGGSFRIYATGNHQYPQIYSNGGFEAMWNYKNNAAEWYVGIRTSSQLLGTEGFHFYNTTSSQTVGGWSIDGHSYSIGSSRAPIFYDQNNTGYYLNPNGSSNLLALVVQDNLFMNAGQLYIGAENGSTDNSYRMYKASGELIIASRESGTWTNRLVITDLGSVIPQGRFQIQKRNDNTNVGTINSTNNQSDWQNLTNSDGQFTVTQYNAIGSYTNSPSGVYTYGSVLSTRTANHSFQLYSSHTGDLAYKTQWNSDNYSGWLTPVVYGRNAGNASSNFNVYGSSFIDKDNTAYYLNPAGDSALNQIHLADYIRHVGDLDTYFGFPSNDSFLIHTAGTDAVHVSSSGNLTAYGDVRTQIFYDSNDTSRYLDPSSTTTSLSTNGKWICHGGHSSARLQLNYAHGSDVANSGTLTGWVSEPGITYNGAGIGGNIHINGQYYGRAYNSGYGCYVRFNKGNGHVEHWSTTGNAGVSGGQGTKRWYNDASGNSYATASSRAPIFYDSASTGYYLNPNDKSNLYSIKLNGYLQGTSAGCAEIGRNHAYDTMELKGYGAEFMIGAQHSTININYRTCNNGASGHTPTDWYWRAGSASSFANMHMGMMSATTQARAPIYYDSANTNYFLDAGGNTSRIQGFVKIGNSSTYNTDDGGWGTRLQVASSVHARIDVAQDANSMRSTWYCHTGHTYSFFGTTTAHDQWLYSRSTLRQKLANGYSEEMASYRAPIFYDSGNTAYYIDPASSSTSLNVAGKGVFAGDVVAFSDKKLKTNIKTLDGTKVLKMRGVSFNKINNNQKGSGVIAQELQEIAPELVSDNNGTLGVAYGNLTGYLIEAIKNQQKTINDLNKRITDLENN